MWYHPHFFYFMFFNSVLSQNHRMVPLIFSEPWDKIFQTEIPDTPPLLSIESFDTGNLLKNKRIPNEKFQYSDTKFRDGKM